jgi:hypothetical protein
VPPCINVRRQTTVSGWQRFLAIKLVERHTNVKSKDAVSEVEWHYLVRRYINLATASRVAGIRGSKVQSRRMGRNAFCVASKLLPTGNIKVWQQPEPKPSRSAQCITICDQSKYILPCLVLSTYSVVPIRWYGDLPHLQLFFQFFSLTRTATIKYRSSNAFWWKGAFFIKQ